MQYSKIYMLKKKVDKTFLKVLSKAFYIGVTSAWVLLVSTSVLNFPSNVVEAILVIPLSSNWKKIFLSSLFKQNKNYLGINKFKKLSDLTKKQVVALGGISKKNHHKLSLLNNRDFAGISYFE